MEFRKACTEAETTEANGLSEVSRKIASGARKDPATNILDRASQKTWKIADDVAETYLEGLKDSWLGMVSTQQLPTLVASTSGMLMTFRTTIWRLISNKSMWPSRLRSAGFCKIAPIIRQSLATIPALCGLVVPPRSAEASAPPPSPVQSYLMKRSSAAPSPQASSSGHGSGDSTPAGTPTAPKKTFGTLPQPSSSPMGPPATTQPMPRQLQTSGASSAATGSSQCPGLFSIIPSLKLGTLLVTTPRGAGRGLPSISSAGLAVMTPGLITSVGGQSSFATNPYSARPAGRSQAAGAPSKDSDEAVESDIAKLARDARHKHHLEEDDGEEEEEGADETDGSDIEDMTASARKGKTRQSPMKSTRKESVTENYTEADIAIVRADRHSRDFPALQNYRNNVALPSDTTTFNLASHQDYLESVMATQGITSGIVFDQEGGREYLKRKGVKDFKLYDNSWKIPLPRTVSGRFPDGTSTVIEKVMMVYRRPNGVVVRDDDKDGFGRTCLMGLWGLHTEGALIRCSHNGTDGKSKTIGVNVCHMCRFWNTNDVTLNNHIWKHYNMGLCCPEDGFVCCSVSKMRRHLEDKHNYKMHSGKDKQAAKQAAKKAAH